MISNVFALKPSEVALRPFLNPSIPPAFATVCTLLCVIVITGACHVTAVLHIVGCAFASWSLGPSEFDSVRP